MIRLIRGNRFAGLLLGRLSVCLLLTWRFPPGWRPFFWDRRQRVLRLGWLVACWRGR